MNPTPALFASPACPTTVAHKVRVAVVHKKLIARLYVPHCHVRNRIGEVAIYVVVVSSITVLIVTVVAVVATLPSATLLPLPASTSVSGPALTPATAPTKALLPALATALAPTLALTSSSARRKKGHSHVGSAAGGRGGHRVDVQQRVPEREHRAIARVRRIDGPRSPPLQSLVGRAPKHAPVYPDDVPAGERPQRKGPAPGASHGRSTHGDGLAP